MLGLFLQLTYFMILLACKRKKNVTGVQFFFLLFRSRNIVLLFFLLQIILLHTFLKLQTRS